MLLGLTNDQKLGLAGTAAVFIVFALVVALLIPRYRPDFPGRKGLSAFVVLTTVLMIAMLGAVEVFAVEEHHGAEAAETQETEPAETETGPTGTETSQSTTAAEEPQGSPEAGKSVFASNGCGNCHVVTEAGSEGAVGPNLDESLEAKDAEYIERAILDPNAEIADGYQQGIMPDFEGQLTPEEVGDLVAFLTQG